MLYIFEDNEALINLMIKCRSRTMRHVSRTHRVALDWLFGGINLDPKIQIKYFDTKNQLADVLTKGSFTRYEWNNPLHLFNISHFSSICCSQSLSSTSFPETMAKRMQEEKEEERIVAKSKPTLNLVSHAATSASPVQSPNASKSAGILRAPCQPDWNSTGRPVAREHNQDGASSSQVWQRDTEMDESTRRLVAAEKDQQLLNFHQNPKSARKLVASGNSDIDGTGTVWPHNLHFISASVPHLEKVFSNVKQRYGRKLGDKLKISM